MNRNHFCLLIITLLSGSLKAQLANSKWKGALQLDGPVNVAFNFGKDTLTVLNLDENSVLETMTYTSTPSAFTIKKINGQSDCESSTIGKYNYQIKDDVLSITLVEDACNTRAPYVDNLQLNKNM